MGDISFGGQEDKFTMKGAGFEKRKSEKIGLDIKGLLQALGIVNQLEIALKYPGILFPFPSFSLRFGEWNGNGLKPALVR